MTNPAKKLPLTAYESMVRALSDRVVEAQRPIRILDAIKWDEDVERDFFEQWNRRRRRRCDSASAEGTLPWLGGARREDENLQKDEDDRGFLHGVDGE